eukprot:evm.model.scf_886.4 EVM.evm.TU.scf_886.4   scf_886:32803-36959(+)
MTPRLSADGHVPGSVELKSCKRGGLSTPPMSPQKSVDDETMKLLDREQRHVHHEASGVQASSSGTSAHHSASSYHRRRDAGLVRIVRRAKVSNYSGEGEGQGSGDEVEDDGQNNAAKEEGIWSPGDGSGLAQGQEQARRPTRFLALGPLTPHPRPEKGSLAARLAELDPPSFRTSSSRTASSARSDSSPLNSCHSSSSWSELTSRRPIEPLDFSKLACNGRRSCTAEDDTFSWGIREAVPAASRFVEFQDSPTSSLEEVRHTLVPPMDVLSSGSYSSERANSEEGISEETSNGEYSTVDSTEFASTEGPAPWEAAADGAASVKDAPEQTHASCSSVVVPLSPETELQDAINLLVAKGAEDSSANVGLGILAALRKSKAKKIQQLNPNVRSGPECGSGSRDSQHCEDSAHDMGIQPRLPAALVSQYQNELGIWFDNPLKDDVIPEGDENALMESGGTGLLESGGTGIMSSCGIILPVVRNKEEYQLWADAVHDGHGIDKKLLLKLECHREGCTCKSSGLLSSRRSIPDPGNWTPGREGAGDVPPTMRRAKMSARRPPSARRGSQTGFSGVCQGEADGSAQDAGESATQGQKEQGTWGSGNGSQRGSFGRGITFARSRHGSRASSFASQLSEDRGAILAAYNAMFFMPFVGLDGEEPPTPVNLPSAADPSPLGRAKEAKHSDCLDCLPGDHLQEGKTTSWVRPQQSDGQGSAAHTSAVPDQSAGGAASGASTHRDANVPLIMAAKDWPNSLGVPPNRLERWQLNLKLVWADEEDDELVAEVGPGLTAIMMTPRPLLPFQEGDEASCSARTRTASPEIAPVKAASPEQEISSEFSNGGNVKLSPFAMAAIQRMTGEPGDESEGLERHDHVAMDGVVMEVKRGTPTQGRTFGSPFSGSYDGLRLVRTAGAYNGLRLVRTYSSPTHDEMKRCHSKRRKTGVRDEALQLHKVIELNSPSGSSPLPSRNAGGPAYGAEPERAMVDDYRNREVALLEMELGRVSPDDDGEAEQIPTSRSANAALSTEDRTTIFPEPKEPVANAAQHPVHGCLAPRTAVEEAKPWIPASQLMASSKIALSNRRQPASGRLSSSKLHHRPHTRRGFAPPGRPQNFPSFKRRTRARIESANDWTRARSDKQLCKPALEELRAEREALAQGISRKGMAENAMARLLPPSKGTGRWWSRWWTALRNNRR